MIAYKVYRKDFSLFRDMYGSNTEYYNNFAKWFYSNSFIYIQIINESNEYFWRYLGIEKEYVDFKQLIRKEKIKRIK